MFLIKLYTIIGILLLGFSILVFYATKGKWSPKKVFLSYGSFLVIWAVLLGIWVLPTNTLNEWFLRTIIIVISLFPLYGLTKISDKIKKGK